jgi:hypothetical protein
VKLLSAGNFRTPAQSTGFENFSERSPDERSDIRDLSRMSLSLMRLGLPVGPFWRSRKIPTFRIALDVSPNQKHDAPRPASLERGAFRPIVTTRGARDAVDALATRTSIRADERH